MTDMTITGREAPQPVKNTLEKRLGLVQAVAGATFAIFVLLHLSNIALAPFGMETFNQYQQAIRTFYQYPAVELLIVILPLAAHAMAGIILFIVRRKTNTKRPAMARAHTWAGCFLLVFIVGHIVAVRGSSFFYDVYPEFEGLAFSLWYFPAYFYPYYFLLALAGFYHATNGLRMLAAKQGLAISASTQRSVTALAACWIAISLAALGGLLFDVGDPASHGFAQLLAEVFGADPRQPIHLFGSAP